MSDIPAINYKDLMDSIELVDELYKVHYKVKSSLEKQLSDFIGNLVEEKYQNQLIELIEYMQDNVRFNYLTHSCSVYIEHDSALLFSTLLEKRGSSLSIDLSILLLDPRLALKQNNKETISKKMMIEDFKHGRWYPFFNKNGSIKKGFIILIAKFELDENFILFHSDQFSLNFDDFERVKTLK